MPATIRALELADLDAMLAHTPRLRGQSGRDGDPITSPRSADERFDPIEFADKTRTGWSRPLDEPGWMRSWGLFVDGILRGNLVLTGGRLAGELHRAMMGIGIERVARGRGHGRTLLVTAIAWARANHLAWMDLGVFAHNAPARALYASLGFVEVGTTRDRFRVEGQSIDDIAMVLDLSTTV